MRSHKRLATTLPLLAIFILALPSLTPRVYGGTAAPCLPGSPCSITILSPGPGAALNKNQNVSPTFLVSFLVTNFHLVQPGTINDVNTTATGPAQNEGHIHVWVDNAYVTIWASVNGIPLTLSPGTHTIRLDLVNDYHATFKPGINATTTVTVTDTLAPLQSTANNAMNYSIGALVVSIITLILVAYVAFKPKPKMP